MSIIKTVGRILGWALASALLIAVLIVLWIVTFGMSVDASQWRDSIGEQISGALDREVWLRGDVGLELSRRPSLRVSRLHIRNSDQSGEIAGGFADIDWLYVGAADVRFDAMHYLRTRELRFTGINAENVAVFLEARSDGVNNWTVDSAGESESRFDGAPRQEQAVESSPDEGDAVNPLQALSELVLDDVQLNRLHVEYLGPDGKLRLFSIPHFSATAAAGKPVTAKLRGVVDSLFPFDVEVTTGPLSALSDTEKPWPVNLTAQALGSTMTFDGDMTPTKTKLQFGWGMPDPLLAGRILQIDLPDVGPTAVAAEIVLQPDKVQLANFRGWMGVTQITGDLAVQLDLERPRITGNLAVPVLDLKPFTQPADVQSPVKTVAASASPPDSEATSSIAQWYRERADGVLDLSMLGSADADVQMSVGQWLSLPGNVRDASLHVQLQQGKLKAPIKAQLAGVKMTGEINLDGGEYEPRIGLKLGATDTELAELAQFLFGLPGVRGRLGSVSFELEGTGASIAEQVDGMRVGMSMGNGELTYGNRDGLTPVAFNLDDMSLDIVPGEPVRIDAAGSLLDQPLTVSFTGAPFRQLLTDGQTRVDLRAKSRTMTARVRGVVGQKSADGEINTKLFVGVSAKRARDAAAWFGIGGKVDAPFSMAGDLSLDGSGWAIRNGRLGVGRNGVRADIEQVPGVNRPLMRATIEANTLRVDELEALFASNQGPDVVKSDQALLDIPVLPADIDLTDTDLRLRISHLTGSTVDIKDLSFDARIRDGKMAASPLAVTIEQIPISGAVELNLRGAEPRVQWWLAANDVDIGKLMRRLKVSENIDATADLFSMHLDARGSRLREALDASSMSIEVTGGDLSIRDRNTANAIRFGVSSAKLQALAGKPLQGEILGNWKNEQVKITLGSGRPVELFDTSRPIPFNATLEVAKTEIEVFGKLGRNFGSESAGQLKKTGELKLNMLVNGERLDSLNNLAGVSLPPWGPYEINGVVKLSGDGYEVPNLSLLVGDSQLDGTGTLLTTESPPRMSVLLSASQLQMNDFRFGDWSPFGEDKAAAKDEEAASGVDVAAVRQQARDASKQTESLLSEKTLRSINGGVRLNVIDVRSGKDKLGSGSLRLNVFDGAATIGPITVRLPDSSASVKINYAPEADAIDMRTQIKADQFDYGFLARRVQPETTLAGRISLDIDVSGRTPTLAQALDFSSGRIGFEVWPENIQADVFDLWATNLFLTLATRLDPDTASKINCGIARFDLKDGLLTHQQILLDTTRVRVEGEGSVNFRTEELSLRMKPQPKKAEFFSLGTPIVVGGTFADFSVGANPGDVAGTAVRLATSLVWVPLQKLFGRSTPGDGEDVCGEPGRFVAVTATTGSASPASVESTRSGNRAPTASSDVNRPSESSPVVATADADRSVASSVAPDDTASRDTWGGSAAIVAPDGSTVDHSSTSVSPSGSSPLPAFVEGGDNDPYIF